MPDVTVASEADARAVTELFARAFYSDPTWSWAFPEAGRRLEQLRSWWGLFVHSAISYGSVFRTADGGAAASWIPPGKPELTAADDARMEPLLRALVGEHANDILALIDQFEEHHPHDPPHYYLSLLATHPDHRGSGKGMGLLEASLSRFDAEGVPTYLESSNRSNDQRYARLGYEQIAEFAGPGGKPSVACMWRDAE